jgi:lipopolysaccharide transport system ATP-binding protein
MSDTVIKVDRLGKRYSLGQVHTNLLSERIGIGLRSFFSKLRRRDLSPLTSHLSPNEDFWALKDVSFEVKQGEVLGIIGRNGAGKSTLLKILSRITKPTEGRAEIYGRVGSLLEVGTGFHPELTGRENIFLNGAILGMSKVEIKKKFDEIVAFGEIEKFIDTPVKRYSSGMYVRLAFSVAAYLEPEILIVDEVLAVGDASFQKKCIGKMGDVVKKGRTVLFVSHNMGILSQLCSSAILLDQGTMTRKGKTEEIISLYIRTLGNNVYQKRDKSLDATKEMYIAETYTMDSDGAITSTFVHTSGIILRIKGVIKSYCSDVWLGVAVKDQLERKIFTCEIILDDFQINKNDDGFIATLKIPGKFLVPGRYSFLIGLHIPKVRIFDQLNNICSFVIIDAGSEFSVYEGLDYGCVFAKCEWNVAKL